MPQLTPSDLALRQWARDLGQQLKHSAVSVGGYDRLRREDDWDEEPAGESAADNSESRDQ